MCKCLPFTYHRSARPFCRGGAAEAWPPILVAYQLVFALLAPALRAKTVKSLISVGPNPSTKHRLKATDTCLSCSTQCEHIRQGLGGILRPLRGILAQYSKLIDANLGALMLS